MRGKKLATLWVTLAMLLGSSSLAQAQDSGSSSAPADAPATPAPPEGNPLEGLFTPQPQYPTPQSQANPQPFVPQGNEENPIKALFNIQPQFPTPQNPGYATPEAPKNTENHLQGFFTGQPQYVTPQTPVNPQPVPKFLIPGFNTPGGVWKPGMPLPGEKKDSAQAQKEGGANSAAGAVAGADNEKTGKDADGKDKSGKDKNGADKDKVAKDGKDSKDAKDKNDKDKADKEKSAADDKEKKDKGEVADKDGDKKDGDKKDSDDKNADAKDSDKKEAKVEPTLPYHPLREAIFLMNTGEYARSIAAIDAILKEQPHNAEAHYLKAVVLVAQRQYKSAGDEYRKVFALVPGTPLAGLAAEGLKKIGGPLPDMPKLPPLQ